MTMTYTVPVVEHQLLNHMLVSDVRMFWHELFVKSDFGGQVLREILNLEVSENILKSVNATPTINSVIVNSLYNLKRDVIQATMEFEAIGWDANEQDMNDTNLNTIEHLLQVRGDDVTSFMASLASNIATVIYRGVPSNIYCEGILTVPNHMVLMVYLRG